MWPATTAFPCAFPATRASMSLAPLSVKDSVPSIGGWCRQMMAGVPGCASSGRQRTAGERKGVAQGGGGGGDLGLVPPEPAVEDEHVTLLHRHAELALLRRDCAETPAVR